MLQKAEPETLVIPDIVFLTDSIESGRKVVHGLNTKGVKTNSTFGDGQRESRRQKMRFYMGDARVKATTLHSFKGWESRALVILIEKDDERRRALLYTGLTRLKRHVKESFLTVVSCASQLRNYGKTWPEYSERLEKSREG